MRVIFACLPAYGHLQPMVPLARACVAAGHDVLVATGPDLGPRVQQLGLEAAAVGPSREEGAALARRGNRSTDGASMRRVWDHYTFVHRFPTDGAKMRAVDLVPLVASWRPDVVVHDVCDFAAPLAAAAIGAASALHSWGPPLPHRLMTRAGAKAAAHWEAAGLVVPAAGGMYRGTYLNLCPPALWPDDAGDIPRVHDLRPEPTEEPGLPLPIALDRMPHARTAHVTLGTVANRSLDTFHTIVDALADLPLNVVVTVGPDRDPRELGTQPAHVLVESFIPLGPLLSRCDVVIAHGGSGTMLATLRAGLPQVIVPYDGDNVRNARLCELAGAAIALPLKELDRQQVRAAVQQALDDDALVRAARRIAAEISAMPGPAEIVGLLEQLAARPEA